jgi:very-short-patch-repair endonuclease
MRAPILTQKRAKALRRSMTQPERTLWALLRRNRQHLHFRRQHAVGPYILDFYCVDAKLCVEVDGPVHVERAEHDRRRTEWLNGQGIRVLRFSAEAVESQPAKVIAAIAQAATNTRRDIDLQPARAPRPKHQQLPAATRK